MKLMACAVLALSLTVSAAQADGWRHVANNSSVTFFVDQGSISGDVVKEFWASTMFRQTRLENGKPYDMIIQHISLDCSTREMRERWKIVRAEDGTIVSERRAVQPPNRAAPGSPEEWIYKAVCLNQYHREQAVVLDELSDALRAARAPLN